MDPLSIVVSTLALATAVHTGLKGVRTLRRADPELMALSNEISNLQLVLLELEDIVRQPSDRSTPMLPIPTILSSVITSLETKLQQLLVKIKKWKPTSNSRIFSFKRLGLAHEVKAIRADLKIERDNLLNHLVVAGLRSSNRLELDLRKATLIVEQSIQKNHETLELVEAQLSNIAGALERESPLSPLLEDEVEHEARNSLSPTSEDLRVFAIDISRTAINQCKPWCSCICHKRRHLGSPRAFQNLIGHLFIGYAGIPIASQPCNQRSCHTRTKATLSITFIFPLWFLARIITFMLTVQPLAGFTASLRTPRTVAGSSSIFTYAKLGDLQGLQCLFNTGQASPFDVHYESGVTALHLAINHKRLNICKYLLDMGADPLAEDRVQCSATDNAWERILGKTSTSDILEELRTMFPMTQYFEYRELTSLHKIVLDLVPGDLDQHLTASTEHIDTVDSNGRTVVSLASERGDLAAVKILLKHRADVTIGNSCDATPLHFAACAMDPCCISPLLEAQAEVDAYTNWRQTPLIYCAAYKRDKRHAEILLQAGATIDWRDLDGITALGWAALSDNVPVARVLLERNADIFNLDHSGETFVSLCLLLNRTEILTILSEYSESTAIKMGGQISVSIRYRHLSATAEHATLETMKVLHRVPNKLLYGGHDLDDLNFWDEKIKSRTDFSEGLWQAWNQLIMKLRASSLQGNKT